MFNSSPSSRPRQTPFADTRSSSIIATTSSNSSRLRLQRVRTRISSEIICSLVVSVYVVCCCLTGQRAPTTAAASGQLDDDLPQIARLRAVIFEQNRARLQQRSPKQQQQQQQHQEYQSGNLSLANTFERDAASANSSFVCQGAGEQDFVGPASTVNQTGGQWQYELNQNRSFGFVEGKISDFVRPTFYTLRLKVDPTKRKFTGQLMIALEVGPPSVQQAPSVDSIDELLDRLHGQQQPQQHQQLRPNLVVRNRNGELGYRYLSLNAGSSIHIRKAFYVFKSKGSVQIPATRIGRSLEGELLTLDFYPNVITSGQGLLLIVYAGQVNETESQGLFVHHSSRGNRAKQTAQHSNSTQRQQQQQQQQHQQQVDDSGLATHMQPNFARRLYPSWDEPHLKARFNLIVVLPFRGYQTISNMPIKRKSISLSSCSGEPLQEIEFHTTPTMSTYLLTLIIGRFDRIESVTASNCKISVYVYSNQTDQQLANSRPQLAGIGQQDDQQQQHHAINNNAKKQAAQMALDVAVKSFDRLELMLGVGYPLQKFDMVALREFDNGGMENWGASIFHENYLLLNEGPPANQTQLGGHEIQVNGGRQRARRLVVPLVVAHEIAHQWFGNLVTSASWTYLWLNEGFAQLFMYEIADSLFPHEHYWHLFLEDSRQAAMQEDELFTSSHVLEYELAGSNASSLSADQLSLFDQLTYNKGAMMVRMLKSLLLGGEQFLAGLRHYLLKHSYDVVTSRQLLLALDESRPTSPEGRPLEPLMLSWLKQEGFPLISVQLSEETATHFRLRLSQERFSLLQLDASAAAATATATATATTEPNSTTSPDHWWVPILFATELQPEPGESQQILLQPGQQQQQQTSYLLNERSASLSLAKSQVGAWLKLNAMAFGYYRVDYLPASGPDLLQRMAPAIRDKSMGPADRFNLVDDLFAMVRSGRKSSGYFLRFVADAYQEETEVIVMRSIVDSLRRIKSAIVSNSPDNRMQSLFDRYVQKYLRKVSQALSGGQSSAKRSADGPMNQQQQQQQRTPASNQQPTARQPSRSELGDLIEGARIWLSSNALGGGQQRQQQPNEPVLRALDLFGRHFRQPSSSSATPSATQRDSPAAAAAARPKSPLDGMDRERRASIYSAALMGATADVDLAANFSLLDELRSAPADGSSSSSANSAALDPILGDSSSLVVASNGSPPLAEDPKQPTTGDTFLRLLKAYESSESSGERFAICSALGTVSSPNKQLKLLELALFEHHFRPTDTQTILDSMARQKVGRQLIWQQLKTQSKSLERRQLLAGLLRSLQLGFIHEEPGLNGGGPSQAEIEHSLRLLYQQYGLEYGNLISQTIELIRINSQWFKQDHDGLLQFLLSVDGVA